MFTTTKRLYSRTAPVFIPGNYFGDGSNGVSTTGSNFVPNASKDMVVANYTSINLNAASSFSVSTPCKGMLIYCQGDLIVSGTISMAGNSYVGTGSADATLFRITSTGSAQSAANIAIMGTSASVSETNQVYSWYNNGITYTIANAGSAGGARGTQMTLMYGKNAPDSTNSCGGGGGGAMYNGGSMVESQTDGTSGSYSGGGVGGAGDNGSIFGGSVPGGAGGGNIILIVKGNVKIASTGIISSKGNNGVDADNISPNENAGSGGGGGGTICILYGGTYINSGSVTANGGTGGLRFDSNAQLGGNGGNGNIYIQKIRSN